MKPKTKYTIKPSTIYFTHSKIRKQFTGCGKMLNETLEELASGKTQISSIPTIKVYTDGTNFYSMNNRRLWVFKELENRGLIDTISVYLEPLPSHSKIAKNKYSLVAKPVLN